MSSTWRCSPCELEGDAPLWAQKRTEAGQVLVCIKCTGRLKLVPLGKSDAEAQAWLEAFHAAKAIDDADRQQNLLRDAQERLSLRFTESALHEIYGADEIPEDMHGQRLQRNASDQAGV